MRIALVYDLRDDYRALGYAEEAIAEFDSPETIDALAGAQALGCEPIRVGRGQARRPSLSRRARSRLLDRRGLTGRSREAQVPALLNCSTSPIFSRTR